MGHTDTLLETQQPLVPTSGLLPLETPTGLCPLVPLHCLCCFPASTAWNEDLWMSWTLMDWP